MWEDKDTDHQPSSANRLRLIESNLRVMQVIIDGANSTTNAGIFLLRKAKKFQ